MAATLAPTTWLGERPNLAHDDAVLRFERIAVPDSAPSAESLVTADAELARAWAAIAPREPMKARRLTADALHTVRTRARDIGEALQAVPGLHVSNGSFNYGARYFIRGIVSTYNPHTLLLVNGIPQTSLFTGDRGERANLPSDHFPPVYYAGQGVPPDLSLIAKARHGGAQYIHSLLTGYVDQAGYKNEEGQELLKMFPDAKTPDGLYFNPYFANLNLAMAAPLTGEGQVTYADGTKATVDQMAKDVAQFLAWAGDPKLQARKEVGLATMVYLGILTILLWFSYKQIWRKVEH